MEISGEILDSLSGVVFGLHLGCCMWTDVLWYTYYSILCEIWARVQYADPGGRKLVEF